MATLDGLAVSHLGCVGPIGREIEGKGCDKQVARKTLSDRRVARGGVTGVLRGVDMTGVLRGVLGVVFNGE